MQRNSVSVPQFCEGEGISRAMFYKLRKNGLAPKIMKIGRLTRITNESANEWRKKMELSTKQEK